MTREGGWGKKSREVGSGQIVLPSKAKVEPPCLSNVKED